MTITQLRYFIIAAKMENLSGAAASLFISQSSLSKNIASLEKELGRQLFDRKGKSLKLNETGEQFLEGCLKITGELDEVLEKLQLADERHSARIRIGVEGEIGPMLSWMADFRQMHPEVVYDIDSSLGTEEHPDINRFDVMVYPEGRKYSKFQGYPYYLEEYYLAVPAQEEGMGAGPVSTRTLGGCSLVFLRQGGEGHEYPYEVCRALMIQPASEHMVDTESMKRKMIAEGIASGFVSSELLELYRNDRKIMLLPLLGNRFCRQMMICFRKEKHLTGIAREFCEYVRSCCPIPQEEEQREKS